MRLTRVQEQQLVKAAQAGDHAALNQLTEAFWDAVFGYIVVRSRQFADAEDIRQNTWAKVGRQLPTFNIDKWAFYTFVHRLAHHELINYYRKQTRDQQVYVLCSELLVRYPDMAEEPEIESILEALAERLVSDPPVDPGRYKWLLETTFAKGGYPWQLVVFGFGRLVDAWTPRRMAEDLSPKKLAALVQRLEQDYAAESELPGNEVRGCFQPLRDAMVKRIANIVPTGDTRSREHLTVMLKKPAGAAVLRRYFSTEQPPTDSISDWMYKVKCKVLREVLAAEFWSGAPVAEVERGKGSS